MAGRTTTNVTKGQMTALLVMALVMGGGGLGLGAYAISTGGQDTQGPAGPQGPQGLQGFQGDQGVPGEQGPAGMVGFVVGIIDPNNGSTVSGIVSVRAMLWNSTPCTFKVLVNGHENATEVPWQWNTSAPQFGDGWWNLTVQAINSSGYVAQDCVLVFIDTTPFTGQVVQVQTASNSTANGYSPEVPMTGMTVTITVSQASTLWCSVSANLRAYTANTAAAAACKFRIWLDQTTTIVEGAILTSGGVFVHEMVSLQGSSVALAAGTHHVEFQYWKHESYAGSGITFNWESTSTLTVMEIAA